MDYTKSDSYSTHAATQQRHHDAAKAIPTVVSDTDLNAINWSLMEIVKAAGLEGKQFNKDDPSSYRLLLAALNDMYAQNVYMADRQYRAGDIIFVPDDDSMPHVGNFYEAYHPDGCKGKDPRDATNRPDGWTNTDPAAPYYWIKHGKWLDLPTIGTPVGLFKTALPQGYLKLNGATVNASKFWRLAQTYPDLVTSGNISLPDLRAEFIRGLDDGRGVDTGRLVGSWQDHALQYHGHRLFNHYSLVLEHRGNFIAGTYGLGDGSKPLGSKLTSYWWAKDGSAPDYVGVAGGNRATETRPRNIALLYATRF